MNYRIVKTLNGFCVERRIEYEVKEEPRKYLWGLLRGDVQYSKKEIWYKLDSSGDFAQRFLKNTEPAEFNDLGAAEEFLKKVIAVGKVVKEYN